jgi:beta-phosphoglucomutase-like phosphatase (HAD superfamily)
MHLQVPTALVCSAPERRVLKTLEEAGLDGFFDTVVTGDDVYRGRPDPEGYLYAAQVRKRAIPFLDLPCSVHCTTVS